MPKIDAQGNVTDATIDEDPDFPAEAQPVDEPRPVMEPADDEKPAPKSTATRKR